MNYIKFLSFLIIIYSINGNITKPTKCNININNTNDWTAGIPSKNISALIDQQNCSNLQINLYKINNLYNWKFKNIQNLTFIGKKNNLYFNSIEFLKSDFKNNLKSDFKNNFQIINFKYKNLYIQNILISNNNCLNNYLNNNLILSNLNTKNQSQNYILTLKNFNIQSLNKKLIWDAGISLKLINSSFDLNTTIYINIDFIDEKPRNFYLFFCRQCPNITLNNIQILNNASTNIYLIKSENGLFLSIEKTNPLNFYYVIFGFLFLIFIILLIYCIIECKLKNFSYIL